MISYGFLKEIPLPFEIVVRKLPGELQKKGFEILSNIRLDTEIRKHLGVDFHRYAILGVCNFPLAYKALLREENFGLVLSCSIIIYEKENSTWVGSLKPTQFTPLLQNEYIHEGAEIIERKLSEVLDCLGKKKFLRENKRRPEEQIGSKKSIV